MMDWSFYFDDLLHDADGLGWNVAENEPVSDTGIVARFATADPALDWLRTQLLANKGGE